jgi:hypothetical protein
MSLIIIAVGLCVCNNYSSYIMRSYKLQLLGLYMSLCSYRPRLKVTGWCDSQFEVA